MTLKELNIGESAVIDTVGGTGVDIHWQWPGTAERNSERP